MRCAIGKVRDTQNFSFALSNVYNQAVAPIAGAWIETLQCGLARYVARVAPIAGAWIETRKK